MVLNIVIGIEIYLKKAHAGGLTAIHATLVYWEDTHESFEKMNYWDDLIQSNNDILLMHAKKSSDIFCKS